MEWNGIRRMRRNRRSEGIRRLVQETRLDVSDLVQPLFFQAGSAEPVEIPSMPGVCRFNVEDLVRECEACTNLGLPAVALFPAIAENLKDPLGSHASSDSNILFSAIRAVKKAVPDLIVISDVALDPFTSHGHDGVFTADGSDVDNDSTVARLCDLAIREAEAGADILAPSDMMDGRVRAIREALDGAGHYSTAVLSYSAKYASGYYGPFRDAVGSSRQGTKISKKTYQMNPANVREAILEVELDEAEGADMVMVKPAGPYLDVIRAVREHSSLPVAAYQVSGEYAQIHAASRAGWIDYEACRDESLLGIKRAGADFILTYFAREVAEGRK